MRKVEFGCVPQQTIPIHENTHHGPMERAYAHFHGHGYTEADLIIRLSGPPRTPIAFPEV